jgi:predicted phage tail protein
MQNAFKGSSVKKSGMSPLALVAFALAGLSTLGMVGLFVSIDDSVAERAETLAQKVGKLEKNESFYLQLKKQLEGENEEMVEETKSLRQNNEALEEEVADAAETVDDLKDEVRGLERDLSNAKDDIVRAQRARPVEVAKEESDVPKVSQTFVDEVLSWARKNSTLSFPAEITLANQGITLTDRSKQVQVPVAVGGMLRATRFHPSAAGYLVVAQLNSDKLLATIKAVNSNFVEVVAPKYVRLMNSMGKSVKNPYEKKKVSNQAAVTPGNQFQFLPKQVKPLGQVAPASNFGRMLKSKALLPQKGEDFLKATDPGALQGPVNDHGSGCVCKDCRVKKIGKGSLFPE